MLYTWRDMEKDRKKSRETFDIFYRFIFKFTGSNRTMQSNISPKSFWKKTTHFSGHLSLRM